MKLKKMLCTLVAVGLTSAAFAGNTSGLRSYIQDFFQNRRDSIEMFGQGNTPKGVAALQTIQALENGLLAYEEQKTAQNLTGLSQEIDSGLTNLLTIYNKINNSSDEVATESKPVLENLTKKIIENQSEIDSKSVNLEGAQDLVFLFSFTNPEAERVLVVRAYKVLAQEMEARAFQILNSMLEKLLNEEGDKE